MKNITLSIPDDLLEKSREYAKRHGSSLNALVRQLLQLKVQAQAENPMEQFLMHTEKFAVPTKSEKLKRSDIYDRKILS